MKKQRLIETLKHNGRMTISELSSSLEIDEDEIRRIISSINKTDKWIKLDVKIVRSGQWGKSSYEIIENKTDSAVILNNINSNIKRSLHHLRRQKELGIVGNKTRLGEELKEFRELVVKTNEEFYRQWNSVVYNLEEKEDKKEKKTKSEEEKAEEEKEAEIPA